MSSRILSSQIIKICFILIGLLLFYQCAKQVRPSGGPVDKTPPKIIQVIPAKNSTFVPLDQVIEFHFNEGMNRKSLEKALFITPDPGDNIKFRWKGKRLIIEFQEKLSEDRTYVITLGTDLKDTHGNGLSSSYTLAFSTGAKISDGKISGRVFSEQAKGVLIWAYILDSNEEPNPSITQPNYITQADNKGGYELSHLSKGTYRIFAIKDVDNNRFFEVGLDGIGVPQKDIQLLSDSLTIEQINFKTHVQDTLGPAISTLSVENNTNLSIRFDEDISEESATNRNNYSIAIDKSKSNESLEIVTVYRNSVDKSQVHLITKEQTEGVEYIVETDSIFDLSGNLIDSEFNYDYFTGVAQPDTFRPKIVKYLPDENATAVELDAIVELFFSEAMDASSLSRNFSFLEDSTVSIAGTMVWPGPNLAVFRPMAPLSSAKRHLIKIPLDSIFDISGNSVAVDSTFLFSFRTVNIDTFSTLSGHIMDEDSLAIGDIHLKAYQRKDKTGVYKIKLEQPGKYEFKNLLPGIYQVEGYRDTDGNSVYSWGRAYPFSPSERFFVYPDSIKVRARWPNEGNDILISK